MHRSEVRDRTSCLDCGGEVSSSRDRAFVVGESGVLCLECSARRGGSYDELHDHWDRAPNLEGLGVSDAERSRIWKSKGELP
ncbi:MAG: hypothetical protein OXT09_05790 [Myxococcales bacterium]|nr:hypothetical protein [Myxococcales bacterium]